MHSAHDLDVWRNDPIWVAFKGKSGWARGLNGYVSMPTAILEFHY